MEPIIPKNTPNRNQFLTELESKIKSRNQSNISSLLNPPIINHSIQTPIFQSVLFQTPKDDTPTAIKIPKQGKKLI